ncbi:RidA family protein [Flavobacterium selenitireducens]|uniref:RidA family protein n=1 Tax=Flavobacterium selenitireducens TaxID=2722704 RepID=UPI00168BC813|nr:RidA family protein [Flavobacterium selenitireducens]MBD3583808.1 RidA family protein [Flavobacterium selenitireducens]
MQKRNINPWTWQDERGVVQAIEVTNAAGTLYVSGQAAIAPDGTSSSADMKTQIPEALQNLERVISDSGYELKNIVRLTIYSTSTEEFIANFAIFKSWISDNGVQSAVSHIEVVNLWETLKIEFEATVVR